MMMSRQATQVVGSSITSVTAPGWLRRQSISRTASYEISSCRRCMAQTQHCSRPVSRLPAGRTASHTTHRQGGIEAALAAAFPFLCVSVQLWCCTSMQLCVESATELPGTAALQRLCISSAPIAPVMRSKAAIGSRQSCQEPGRSRAQQPHRDGEQLRVDCLGISNTATHPPEAPRCQPSAQLCAPGSAAAAGRQPAWPACWGGAPAQRSARHGRRPAPCAPSQPPQCPTGGTACTSRDSTTQHRPIRELPGAGPITREGLR